MLFDLPARVLYRRGRNLYTPMRVFASHYCLICRIVVTVAALWLVYDLLTRSLLASFGILR